jgi:hypothetical protein
VFEEFHRELMYFDTTGDLRKLPHLGRELVHLLRHHVEREEHELHPVVLREFKDEDWLELGRLFVDSEIT